MIKLITWKLLGLYDVQNTVKFCCSLLSFYVRWSCVFRFIAGQIAGSTSRFWVIGSSWKMWRAFAINRRQRQSRRLLGGAADRRRTDTELLVVEDGVEPALKLRYALASDAHFATLNLQLSGQIRRVFDRLLAVLRCRCFQHLQHFAEQTTLLVPIDRLGHGINLRHLQQCSKKWSFTFLPKIVVSRSLTLDLKNKNSMFTE